MKFSEVCFVHQDLCIDIDFFITHSNFQTDIQSFFQEVFYQNFV